MSTALRDINEVVREILAEGRREAERWAKQALADAEERARLAERTRLTLLLLGSAGIEPTYAGAMRLELDLGFFPSTRAGSHRLAERVRAVREALGCCLEVSGRHVHDAAKRTIEVSLRPADFPCLALTYRRKLPKEAKCKIVRHRSSYATLVCEL